MKNETIIVTNTESGQAMEVIVFNKNANKITVVIGQGIHNVQCDLTPTKNRLAYAGNIMGREIVYNRSYEQVKADMAHNNPAMKKSRLFK